MKRSAGDIVYSVGMSERPEYYSGRGATMSDLTGTHLEKIWQAIKADHGEAAAAAFVQMVASTTPLSGTAFLHALYRLQASDWVWQVGHDSNIAVLNDDKNPNRTIAHGVASIVEAMTQGSRQDQTNAIRDGFLRSHGVTVSRSNDYGF